MVEVLFGGLIGTILGGVVSYFGAIRAVKISLRDNSQSASRLRETRVASSVNIRLVEPNGTMYISNGSEEALMVSVSQKRIYQDVGKLKPKASERQSIDLMIQGKEYSKIFDESGYSTKFDSIVLGTNEVITLPECEMYGFKAEDIREVMVATTITFKTLDASLSFRKVYIHRFTMGENVPEPRASWTMIYSNMEAR